MRSVEPESRAAASAASLVASTTGTATGSGAPGAPTDSGSAKCVEGCKLAGTDVSEGKRDSGAASLAEECAGISVASAVGSCVGTGKGRGSGATAGAGSEEALHTVSGTAVLGVHEDNAAMAFAWDFFGGIAGTTPGGVEAGAAEFGLSREDSTLPVVARVSCNSLITSRSFPLFLSALPVLPAPQSTNS